MSMAPLDTLLYRERRYLALVVLMIVALGAAAFTSIGRQEDPTITNLFATIITPYPGASPERVEALVTEKIEAQLRGIPEIEELRSTSSTGISSVNVELSSFISHTRIEQVWSEIRDALSDAAREFPAGVPEPEFDNDRTGAFTLIGAIAARATDLGTPPPLAIMSRYARTLQDRLRNTPGTRFVDVYGGAEEEVLVEFDAYQLASAGLTPDSVSAAIARADAKVEAGRVRGTALDYLVEVDGEIDSIDRVRRIPLNSASSGALLRVGDVATVTRSTREPAHTIAYSNGERVVLVAARMESDLQVDAWTRRLQAETDAFSATLPAALEYRTLFMQNEYTTSRLREVATNLGIGVALVVAVLFIAMGWRAALVVAVILPLASCMSLFVLERAGISIHQMSVTGLVVALGLLVDAGIVMTDEIRKRIGAGMTRTHAVGKSVRRLGVPLLASTVTTVLAFMPMALLPGPAGDFVGAIAVSVIVMLTASLALALTVTPALAGLLLADASSERGRRWWRDGAQGAWLGRAFAWTLRLSLRERGVSVLAALALPVIGFASFPTLTAQFFPGVDRDQFYVQLSLAEGAALEATDAAVKRADRLLRSHPDIDGVQWVLGASAPPFYYNMLQDRDAQPGYAEALVRTRSARATERLLPQMQTELDRAVPQAQVLVRGLVQGPPVSAPLEMRLVGPELSVLRRLGEQARQRMAALPSVTHTTAQLKGGAPKLVFELDEDKVRIAGLELGSVARQLETLLEGVAGGSLVEANEELPVRVRLNAVDRSSAERIADLVVVPVTASTGATPGRFPAIPLRALGKLSVVPAASPIARLDGQRINTAKAYLQRDVLPEEALAELKTSLASNPMRLAPGYRIEWGGDSDARDETVRNLSSTLGLVIVLTIATIVLTFNSWRLAGIAFVVCGLSMGLSLLALAVAQFPFGIQALIGVIGSIGVSINAAIIIMTALQADPRAAAGDREAICAVVMDSSRHIVATTITTFGGFLPLILEGGGFWPPFAVAIAGGVLLSMVVSFYFVPPMFSLLYSRPCSAQREQLDIAADATKLVSA